MKISFKSLLGTVPRGSRSVQEVTLSIKKEDRVKITPSNQLRLSEKAREKGADKFVFIQESEEPGGDFKVVYDLYVRIGVLSKTLVFINTDGVLQIIPARTIDVLEEKLQDLFTYQKTLDVCFLELQS